MKMNQKAQAKVHVIKSSYKNSHAEENSASNLMLGENAVILGDVNSIGSNVVLGDNTGVYPNLGQIIETSFYLLRYSYRNI